ncbi:hypothetical protein [Bordetella bronchialis]|uniref:Uncharacterized protein n=1 Tax=Bordetella bronchialis TaxID=463025 RepID=A0A193FTK3_9BORD|nr:hypothetical protein [Bordetella bronchialis]ANN66003.1 hypothetical protein BAU06_06560 [Bordetella bronchialis]ANN71087.1 hypothetical protein BAU08_06820 [Bordetella bronchialis]
MQIRPSSNTASDLADFQARMAAEQAAIRQINDAIDIDCLVRSYYGTLDATTPMYDEPGFPAALGSQVELGIRAQLAALVDKAATLLAEHSSTFTDADERRLQSGFGDKIRQASLHPEERLYFYSQPFKATLERKLALADRAGLSDHGAAMKELRTLVHLLGDPSRFFTAVVGKSIVQDFADAFQKATDGAFAASTAGTESSSRRFPLA